MKRIISKSIIRNAHGLLEWRFDRYRNGRKMAEGATVHAATEALALIKAKELFYDCRGDTFELSHE